jgi:Mitochondrial import 2
MSTDSFDPSASISSSQPSFIEVPSNGSDAEVDFLPDSEPDSDQVTVSEDYEESDAEREWKENLQQLEMMLSMVIVPYMGKYFGRKFAYWGEFCSFL